MSNAAASRIQEVAERTLLNATWAQWATLTAAAIPADRRRAWTIVDPEALVLASLTVGHRERRLDDIVASWARDAANLMSMHRMRALVSGYPSAVHERLGIFTKAASSGGDRRWRRLSVHSGTDGYTPRLKPLGELRLIEAPALTLRLRAGFGVNAKADLLSLLIGFGGAAADLKVIAAAIAYTERAVRTATEEMTVAGLIHEIEGRPSSFYADPTAWAQVLQPHSADRRSPKKEPEFPRWRFWAAVFVFLARVIDWSSKGEHEAWSRYVTSSRARDILEEHDRRLRQANVSLPEMPQARGDDVLRVLEEVVNQVDTWTSEGLYGPS